MQNDGQSTHKSLKIFRLRIFQNIDITGGHNVLPSLKVAQESDGS